MANQDIVDVTIIGGGPAGLYAAFYSGLRGMKTKIIEYQKELGGKIHVYPEKMVWDVGGVPPISGATLIEQCVKQGLTFQPEVVLGTKVETISRESGIFVMETSLGENHYSKTVIVAVGGGILNPQRIAIEGAERFEVTNLNYTVQSLQRFKDKNVIISGGGNSAIDWAHELEGIAKQVYITCRNNSFSCHESQAEELDKSSVVCFFHTEITQFIADKQQHRIEKVVLTNTETGHIELLSIDEVIVSHGYERDTSLLDNSEVEVKRKDNYFIETNAKGESSVPGLYAAGDILMHEGKLNLIAGAFQDSANAVNLAKQWLEPGSSNSAMVSSHNKVLREKNREIIERMIK